MWEKLYQFGRQLLTIKSQVDKNTEDIKELRQDLKQLTSVVQKLVIQSGVIAKMTLTKERSSF